MNKIKRILFILMYSLIGISFSFVYYWICTVKYKNIFLFIGSLLAAGVSLGVCYLLKKTARLPKTYYINIIAAFLVLMFFIQVVCGYYLEITPKWDFYNLVQAAICWAETGSFDRIGDFGPFADYFYIFSIQTGPLVFFMAIFKIAHLLGINDYSMAMTAVNSLLNVAMMFAVTEICRKKFGMNYGLFAVYIFAISLPSYFCAPVFYTDVLTMLYPALFYYLYLLLKEAHTTKKRIAITLLMGFSLGVGLKVKFTVVIMVIAVIIDMIFNWEWKKILTSAVPVACSTAIVMAIFHTAIFPAQLDPVIAEQKALPVVHWISMGMAGDGGYNQADVDFVNSFTGKAAKTEAVIGRIKERVKAMDFAAWKNMIITKSTKCFGDGTYELSAFFYHGTVRDTWLNKYVTSDGKYFNAYSLWCTSVYLGFFLLMIWGTISNVYQLITGSYEQDVWDIAPHLSYWGLLLFLLMWETSARYTVNFIPVLYICAIMGARSAMRYLSHR